jgi:glycyl-tRNA synthetase
MLQYYYWNMFDLAIDFFGIFHYHRFQLIIGECWLMLENSEKAMEKVVSLCKNRGFVYAGSEIYGGLSNTWDYGPLGVEFKNNVKRAWWQKFVQENPYNVGLDSAILMNPQTWVASGHVGGFTDPLMDCKDCKTRHRADKLIEDTGVNPAGWGFEQMSKYIADNKIACPECGSCNFTDIRKFNLMFKTFQGVTEDSKNELFLRPETAQGIFVNFPNIQRTTRRKVPFGVCQIGKSFRNEITPGNFIFRTREFEQMELEFFCRPGTELDWFKYWKEFCRDWLLSLGMKEKNLRMRDHEQKELSHYSNATTDFEFLFPFGWGELWGVASRTNFDLTQHQNTSGKSLEYFDQETGEKYLPYVIEPSLGADRVALAFLCAAYDEEVIDAEKGDTRVVMHLHPTLAPIKAAVLPLSKKLNDGALEIYRVLSKKFMCEFDDAGSIGKRYRRQDEIGTPFCVTFDFDSLEDNCVTVRDRDTMEQIRMPISQLVSYIDEKTQF